MLRAMPTTPVAGAFVGEVELKGVATTVDAKIGFLSECACVQYSWTVEEHWKRPRVVTTTDGKGRTTTRVVIDHGTDTIASGSDQAELELEDPTGRILVQFEGATIEPSTLFDETVDESSPLYYGKGPRGSVNGSTGERTFTETGITVGAKLYVVGYARERSDCVAVEVARGGRAGTATEGARARLFLISTRDEASVSSGHGTGGWLFAVLGFVAVVALLFADFAEDDRSRRSETPWFFVSGVAGYGTLFGALWALWMFNELVDLRNRVIRASSNIDVQLKRRCDLIGSLLECVRAVAGHEESLQKAVAFLRSQETMSDRRTAHSRASVATPVVRALAEGYPTLTAGAVFLRLQEALSEAEQRIALARDEFNGHATGYNARIAEFPARLIAGFALMRRANFFEAPSFERAQPTPR